jgi:uncharacterized membrane protein YqhA
MKPQEPLPVEPRLARALGHVRYLAAVAVLGLSVTMLATFALAIARTATLISTMIDGGWREELIVVSLLKAIDTYLLAVVQLIVVVGIYELFIGDLALPDWLEARSLEDLKKPIIDVLVVFIAIKGIEKLFIADKPIDALTSVGAVAVLILTLTAFRSLTASSAASARSKASGRDGDPHP